MKFIDHGIFVKLQGIPPAPLALKEIPVAQFAKWSAANDIWALAIVDTSHSPDSEPCPPQI